MAWSGKVSFKHRTLHWAGLEIPEVLMDLDRAKKELPGSDSSIPNYGLESQVFNHKYFPTKYFASKQTNKKA